MPEDNIVIKGGRIIDPSTDLDTTGDIFIEGSKIKQVGLALQEAERVIDAKGLWILPGLIDIHVHLREPGDEEAETIQSGINAAINGGFTSIVSMANTRPPIDNRQAVLYVKGRAAQIGLANVFPVGTVTEGLKGQRLADLASMSDAGAVGFSDDGRPVIDEKLMMEALDHAKRLGKPVISHCEDITLTKDGVMHQGEVSSRLGLAGIPRLAEERAVARDIALAEQSGAKLHIAHVSTRGSLELIRAAKERGTPVTCDVTPHHLLLTHEYLLSLNTKFKMNPPLREKDDTIALREGLSEGVIDAIASDHAPHTWREKGLPIQVAPFGVIGLETTLPIVLTELVEKHGLSLKKVLSALSHKPAQIMGIPKGRLSEGADADIIMVDPKKSFRIDPSSFASKSRNTPFDNWRVWGDVVIVILGGKIVKER